MNQNWIKSLKILAVLPLIVLLIAATSSTLNTVMYDRTNKEVTPYGLKITSSYIKPTVFDIPGTTSILSIYGSNQFWQCFLTTNVSIVSGDLSNNVIYSVYITNNSSTITWPGTFRWLRGKTLSTAPTMQAGEYILRVQKINGVTNAWDEVGPEYEVAAGLNTFFSTNSGVISINSTNRSGLYRTVYIDAAAMVSNITAGATFSTFESATPTNRMVDSYVFSGSASNIVQFKLAMPLEWDLGTVKVKLWTYSTNNISTTTNIWGIAAAAGKSTTVLSNLTWGTELEITNVVSSSGGQMLLTPATPALTIGNTPVSAGQLVWFYIMRKPLDADDNDSGQQHLLGAWIQYKEKNAEEISW